MIAVAAADQVFVVVVNLVTVVIVLARLAKPRQYPKEQALYPLSKFSDIPCISI